MKDSSFRYNLEKSYAPVSKKEYPWYLKKKVTQKQRDDCDDLVAEMRSRLKY